MTIAFAFEIFLPVVNGVFTASHNLALNLRDLGHTVIYLAPGWKESSQSEVDGIPVHYIRSYESYVYPGMRVVVPWSRHVQTVLARKNVDIVHATGPWLLNWAALRAARKLGIATVQTFHTMLQDPTYVRYFTHSDALVPAFRRIAWRYFGLYMDRSDVVTGPSRYVVEELSRHYQDLKVLQLPNGIDVTRLQTAVPLEETRRQYPLFNESSFVFIGRMGPEKSIHLIIEAAATALQQNPDFRLFLIGEGPSRRKYEKMVRDFGIEDAVCFLGRLSPSELASSGLLQNAVANVTASTTESFGMTVVEAMAAGTPSIVPDVPGISELVMDAELLFPRGNTRQLARKMNNLSRDHAARERLRDACLHRIREFEGRHVAERFLEVYRTLL